MVQASRHVGHRRTMQSLLSMSRHVANHAAAVTAAQVKLAVSAVAAVMATHIDALLIGTIQGADALEILCCLHDQYITSDDTACIRP
jgi:hypothetical protein